MSAGPNVLIVDDEPDVVTYLGAILEAGGFAVHTADNTRDGLKLAEKYRPDLICLDIMMPKESGLSMYTKLRAHKDLADVPVIIISGIETEQEFSFRQLVNDNSIPPPEAFFEKPINVAEFEKTVRLLVAPGNRRPRHKRNSTL